MPHAAGTPDDAGEPHVLRRAAVGALAFVTPGALAVLDGGYFPHTWGPVALLLLLVTAGALVLADRIELGVYEIALVAGLILLVGWVALSTAWSDSVPRTVLEVQRGFVYVAAMLSVLVVARRECGGVVLGGVMGATAVVSVYALLTRLVPDRFGYDASEAYRLARPLGYWNSLGILTAIGVVLAVGFAAHASTRSMRAVGAALVPILVTTVAFTFSRGAWLALGAGILSAIAFSPRRLRLVGTLVVVAPPSALAVWLTWRLEGLSERATSDVTVDSGRVMLAMLAGIALVSSGFSLLAGERGLRVRSAAGRVIGAVAAVAAAGAIGVAFVNPGSVVGRVSEEIGGSVPASGEGLEDRLISFSGSGRGEYWGVAWSQFSSSPILGTGAGTYELYWTRHRASYVGARDAHNLYLETLAETGPVGLILLVALLAIPVVAHVRGPRHALGAAGLGAYVAYVVHAGIDWDWEVPAVTLSALLTGIGVALTAGSRRVGSLSTWARAGFLGGVMVISAFAFVTAVGNGALVASERAAARGEQAESEKHAKRAILWAPWSSEAWLLAGRAQIKLARPAEARASFERGVDRDPADWRLWYELAFASRGPLRRAAFDMAARLNPRGPALSPTRGG